MNNQALRLRSVMVDGLVGSGALVSDRWVQAFLSVPRHEFVREFFVLTEDGSRYVPASLMDEEERLALIYADEAWITQLNGGQGTSDGEPTSSSSAPSLMAAMLEALDVTDTSTVLELGTGTGYNAALLCAGVPDEQITSVDIDTHLVEQAREVLARLGHHPKLYAASGETPAPGIGRFDRLIATYGETHIPSRWLSLVKAGGIIVTPIYREQPVGAMIRLTVEAPGRASGRFLPFYGGFMPSRRRSTGIDLASAQQAAEHGDGTTRESALPPLSFGFAPEPWQFYAALALGDVKHVGVMPEEGSGLQHWLLDPDGSWAVQRVQPGDQPVIREGGPRQLWHELENAYTRWHDWEKPERERFGLTVTPNHQDLWLDDPTNTVPGH